MSVKNKYKGTLAQYESKLERVMDRFGADSYTFDYSQSRTDASAFVQMRYHGKTYRFENSISKSAECGKNYKTITDLFASIVLTLEGMARATEQGIISMDMLLTGVPALPEAGTRLPSWATVLGLTTMPGCEQDVRTAFAEAVKKAHPDTNGTGQTGNIEALKTARQEGLDYFKNTREGS